MSEKEIVVMNRSLDSTCRIGVSVHSATCQPVNGNDVKMRSTSDTTSRRVKSSLKFASTDKQIQFSGPNVLRYDLCKFCDTRLG